MDTISSYEIKGKYAIVTGAGSGELRSLTSVEWQETSRHPSSYELTFDKEST